ncbi:MAG TPA: Rieske 2Fe-2S domain-containing protein [Burkholderiales bacterium]|nr:Rieske 2Fe-2S domain-containing protein [Burkholderiales bacterium]
MSSVHSLREERPAERRGVDITSTRPGTPGGQYMRQFWLAIHRSEDLAKGHAKPIRIMSEEFTLYRGESGHAQVLDYRCPHRGAPLHLGWVEGDALRCLYHGWKFECSGQCIEMPAEDANFARKVKARSYPTREYLGLVFAYFGEGEPPAFPPFPASSDPSLVHVWNTETVPCNWLQCYENSADEVHVAFVHQPGGSHAAIAELPEVSAEETDWGMLRLGTRKGDKVRISLHYVPNVTRVVVPPLAGFDGVGGWSEIFFSFTPVDDENHLWLITSQVKVTGRDADSFLQKKADYLRRCAEAPKVMDLVHDVWAGRRRLIDVEHPDLAIVQDIAVQAGQGRIADRDNERLGRSDTAIILWRKILTRELSAIAAGRAPKKWSVAPPDVVPTLGF